MIIYFSGAQMREVDRGLITHLLFSFHGLGKDKIRFIKGEKAGANEDKQRRTGERPKVR